MEVTKTLRVVEHENAHPDVLKISITPDPVLDDMHELVFIRSHGESSQRHRFFLASEDMLNFADTLSSYNKGFISE